ncbi:MAG: SRPBCC family protein, partial [Deltaproteobacteria bacterium]|nr:SRPBCC family protein [Deltaproteobacteria bacterium]
MTTVYYSTVIDHPAEQVWSVIRDFNSYPVWVEGIRESHIEEGKAGDAVGAIRNFVNYDGAHIRQRLLAHSDLERFYTFESCEPFGAITYYQGTGRVTPIVDGDRAFVEWSTVFECSDEERKSCIVFFKE